MSVIQTILLTMSVLGVSYQIWKMVEVAGLLVHYGDVVITSTLKRAWFGISLIHAATLVAFWGGN
jgi:hypothetical protein